MPFESKEMLRVWQIVFVDYIEGPKGGWEVMFRFEVTSPAGKEKSIRPIFTMEFVDDYFQIPGDQNMSNNRSRIIREKIELFKKWCTIRIEECIDKDCLEAEPPISQKDFEWAAKIEKGYLKPSSQQQGDNTYMYIPERKIGFK